jgi:hypothetical protein
MAGLGIDKIGELVENKQPPHKRDKAQDYSGNRMITHVKGGEKPDKDGV